MKNNKWMAEHIIDHLTNGENGEITDPMLEEWLGESTSNRREFAYYQRIWKESASCLRKEAVNVELAWEKIDASNRKDALRRMRLIRIGYVISGIAASLLIVLALSTIGVFDRKTDLLVRMSTGYGNRSEVVLPDGSVVKLNSGSELVYTYDADKKTREVHFQGEGFFDVAKDKDKPFVIRMADSLRLCVHGTSFNLRAYADEEMVKASLVKGRIELGNENERLAMNAGDMAVFDRRTKKIQTVDGNLSHSYSWLDDKLYMEHTSLSSVCKYLERRYNVNIELQEGLGESIHYNGVIQEDNVTDILNVLSRLSDIDYTMKGKDICITSKQIKLMK